MYHVMTGVHLLLHALMVAVTMHATHAWHPARPAGTAGTHVLQGLDEADATSPRVLMATDAEYDTEDMHDVEPFVASNAIVHGPVRHRTKEGLPVLRHEATLHDGSGATPRRALLHGPKRLNRYPVCNNCLMLRCDKSKFCRGHCRKKGALNRCSSNTVSSPADELPCFKRNSEDQTVEDFVGLPPDTMGTYDTAIVTVPAPYIGCADIGGRTSGCPAPGTAATLLGRLSAVVSTSSCRTEYYIPDCPGPLTPFGICECVYDFPSPPGSRPIRGGSARPASGIVEPCRTTQLAGLPGAMVDGSDGFGGEEGPVVVPDRNVTQTWYSNLTFAGDTPQHVHVVTASLLFTEVEATLTYFRARVLSADYLQEEEVVEDYTYGQVY